MEGIEKGIEKLKNEFGLTIPKEYEDFVLSIEMFDYSWSILSIDGIEFELNHFLGVSGEASQDLYLWYMFADDSRLDYLTIAMGFGNEEIAIKVKGKDLGRVVLIDKINEENIRIRLMYNTFSEFKIKLMED